MKLSISIQEVAYHRNGICGAGFYAVRFQFQPDDADAPENFLGILFDGRGECAVLSLDRIATQGIAFAQGNSWRGDHFESDLRRAIETEPTSGGVRVGPFCIPTEPQSN